MSLEKIRETIMQASAAEADRINATAQKEAGERLKIKKEDLLRELEHQFQIASRQMEEEHVRKIALFQGGIAKEVLEAKNAAFRSILEKARHTVLSWNEETYGNVMKGFLNRITSGRKGSIRVHRDDRTVFESLIRDVNSGRTDETRIAIDEGSLPHKGGFIFISEGFEVDATLETIFSDIERAILPEIAEDLARI